MAAVRITRGGKPVAELHATRAPALTAEALIARRRSLPPGDPAALRADLDEVLDADSTPLPFTADRPPSIHIARCKLRCMRTNIEIDDEVLREAQRLTGARTKRETVDLALRELVARQRRVGILDLRGRVHWEGDLDESRRGRT